jgi:hypothetical protein
MTQYKFNVKTQSYVGNLTWNANGTLGSLGITDPFNATDTQSCSYAHDDLVRIASVNCGAATWQQTFSYDAFGNITKSVPTGGTGNSFQPTYSAATNRMTSLPSFTPTYDANGNVLTNSAHTYAWDAEGKHVSVDGTAYTYDALGRKVEIAGAGFSNQTFYLPDGSQVLFAGQVARRGNFNLPGGERVNYDSTAGGLLNYGHADHLGSLRLFTTPTQTYADSLAYAPFAETYAVSGQTADQAFTGMGQAGELDTFGFTDNSAARRFYTLCIKDKVAKPGNPASVGGSAPTFSIVGWLFDLILPIPPPPPLAPAAPQTPVVTSTVVDGTTRILDCNSQPASCTDTGTTDNGANDGSGTDNGGGDTGGGGGDEQTGSDIEDQTPDDAVDALLLPSCDFPSPPGCIRPDPWAHFDFRDWWQESVFSRGDKREHELSRGPQHRKTERLIGLTTKTTVGGS